MQRVIPPALIWGAAWAAMCGLDGRVDLANLAMLVVLAAALAALWLPVAVSLLTSVLAVAAFNWCFVPPRRSLAIDLHQHALLLVAMLALSWITALLVARLHAETRRARRHAREADQLRGFAERLRDAERPEEQAEALAAALQPFSRTPVARLLSRGVLPARNDDAAALIGGAPDADQREGLWACARAGHAFGPGTGRHEELAAWYLPLRGRHGSFGAVLLGLDAAIDDPPCARAQAQALCDQLGLALERQAGEQAARRAQESAESQAMRNALLAAISHDYRTPLATIMSAASALQDQDARLSPAQRRRLATTIVDETEALARFTDNTLQLARLDAPGVALRLDWESAEDLVGAVVGRARRRHPDGPRVRARLEPGLPLLRCDALLLTQALDNLVDNGLKYGGEAGVELLAKRDGDAVVLAVRDRGPGVPPAWRERIFEVFQRGAGQERPDGARGAGVGLAACRAIARAHGGAMRYRARSHGGASFEIALPVLAAPVATGEAGGERAERWAAPEPARVPVGDRPAYSSGEGLT